MIFHSLTFARFREKCFNTSGGTLQMLTNGKIMFDCYYSLNSTKPLQKVFVDINVLENVFIENVLFMRLYLIN